MEPAEEGTPFVSPIPGTYQIAVVIADSLGCDLCPLWFHDSTLCMGLPQSAIQTVKDAGGVGILFACTGCRVDSSGSPSRGSANSGSGSVGGGALRQLHETVRALSASVRTLTEQVTAMASAQAASGHASAGASDSPNVAQQPSSMADSPSVSLMIRKEIVEMEERRKRKDSLIVRGIKATNNSEALAKINQAATLAVGSPVPLSSPFCINRDKGIYRVTCTDAEKRQELLQKAKTLKNNEQCKHIYINRDLTYMQRQELYVRRQQSRSDDDAVAPAGGQHEAGATTSANSSATGGDAGGTQCSLTAASAVPCIAPLDQST